jgi:hypothetical protein
MSDLDKWYMWHEVVTDTSKPVEEFANMVCVMKGQDIVRYRREWDDLLDFNGVSDEDVLSGFIAVHWAVSCNDPSMLKITNE